MIDLDLGTIRETETRRRIVFGSLRKASRGIPRIKFAGERLLLTEIEAATLAAWRVIEAEEGPGTGTAYAVAARTTHNPESVRTAYYRLRRAGLIGETSPGRATA